jgi:hypothetical protein
MRTRIDRSIVYPERGYLCAAGARGRCDRLDLGRPNGTGHRELAELTGAGDPPLGLPQMVEGDIGWRVGDAVPLTGALSYGLVVLITTRPGLTLAARSLAAGGEFANEGNACVMWAIPK